MAETKVHNITEYAESLVALFSSNADNAKAKAMQAYMKHKFSFLGIQATQRKQLTSKFTGQHGYPAKGDIADFVKLIWQQPYRELHYVAQEIASRKEYLNDERYIDLVEYMITNASWWDTVDFISADIAGNWFLKHPHMIPEITGSWINSDNLWLRRSALLFQLQYKRKTNTTLLFSYIRQVAHETEFFIRKAAGWALRQYAKTDMQAVVDFVTSLTVQPLTHTEALKRVGKVKSTVWYLQMTDKPRLNTTSHAGLPDGFTVQPFNNPGVIEYLRIYRLVGDKYKWSDRLMLPHDKVKKLIASKDTDIFLLKHNDNVAGFVEFDYSKIGETEIVYFGLTEKYIGMKLGKPFLSWAIDYAWDRDITRLWLHTCDLDHEAALPFYQKMGFRIFDEKIVEQKIFFKHGNT